MLMAVLMVLCVNNCSNLYLCIKSQIPSLHVSPMCSHAIDINQVFSVVSAWRVLFHDAIGYDFCSYHIHLKSNGSISRLNAVILGEALSSEENDIVLPSDDFSRQALVPSPQKVAPFPFLLHFK